MESENDSPSLSPTNSSPAPPKLFRQHTVTGLPAHGAAAAGSPPGVAHPAPNGFSLGSVLGALAPGFARAPSSANSAYAEATPEAHGASPGATGRGLHAAAFQPSPGAFQPAVGHSPITISQPAAKSRAAVMEEAFDAALWF